MSGGLTPNPGLTIPDGLTVEGGLTAPGGLTLESFNPTPSVFGFLLEGSATSLILLEDGTSKLLQESP